MISDMKAVDSRQIEISAMANSETLGLNAWMPNMHDEQDDQERDAPEDLDIDDREERAAAAAARAVRRAQRGDDEAEDEADDAADDRQRQRAAHRLQHEDGVVVGEEARRFLDRAGPASEHLRLDAKGPAPDQRQRDATR